MGVYSRFLVCFSAINHGLIGFQNVLLRVHFCSNLAWPFNCVIHVFGQFYPPSNSSLISRCDFNTGLYNRFMRVGFYLKLSPSLVKEC